MRGLQETTYQTKWRVNHGSSNANATFVCGARIPDERDRVECVYTHA
jgi:hypothetical protein